MASNNDETRGRMDELSELRAKVGEFEALAQRNVEREKLLQHREEVLRAALDAVTDGVLVVGENGHIIVSNKRFAKMWHIPPDLIDAGDDNELVQFVAEQLLDPEAFLSQIQKLYRSVHESCDILRFRDGRVFERFSLPLVIDDTLCGRVWSFRDVTGEHRDMTGT